VYYWWSACCTGKQGQNLIPDADEGLPTCVAGMPALECKRRFWQQKLETDLLDDSYNFQAAPADTVTTAHTYGGVAGEAVGCKCNSTDPRCEMAGSGSACLVCRTDEPCSDESTVKMSISFFKVTSVDLRSSVLEFSAWLRQIWCACPWSTEPSSHQPCCRN
jgi:hypothetical protein